MVLTSNSFFPPFNFILYQFADCVTDLLADFDSNPSEVSSPALGYEYVSTFYHTHCGFFCGFSYPAEYISTDCDCISYCI